MLSIDRQFANNISFCWMWGSM